MTHTLTPDKARSFDYFSRANADVLTAAATQNGCTCQPYLDWYTYQRWQAQGFQVRKGEHGVRLLTWVDSKTTQDTDDTDTTQAKPATKRPWPYTAFCRCQVDKKGRSTIDDLHEVLTTLSAIDAPHTQGDSNA